MDFSLHEAATDAGDGFVLTGAAALIYASLRHPRKRLTTARKIEIAGVAGYYALLGSVFGLLFYIGGHAI
jgi:hypothetical protein